MLLDETIGLVKSSLDIKVRFENNGNDRHVFTREIKEYPVLNVSFKCYHKNVENIKKLLIHYPKEI